MNKAVAACSAVLVFLLLSLSVQARPHQQAHSFDQLVDEYFDFHFQFHPSDGTLNGFHQYDHKLEDYSAKAAAAEVAGLNDFKIRFVDSPSHQASEPDEATK